VSDQIEFYSDSVHVNGIDPKFGDAGKDFPIDYPVDALNFFAIEQKYTDDCCVLTSSPKRNYLYSIKWFAFRTGAQMPSKFFYIPTNILSDVKSGRCKIAINNATEGADYDFTDTNLQLKKVNINGTDFYTLSEVLANTCKVYDLQMEHFIYLTANMRLKPKIPITVIKYDYIFYNMVDKSIDCPMVYDKEYKILSLNKKQRPHRTKFINYLIQSDQLDGNCISAHWIDMKIDPIHELDPRFHFREYHNDIGNIDIFLDSYVNFVTDTWLETSDQYTHPDEELILTEKISKSILMKQPFVFLGREGVLQELRNRGFKTFMEWWDESYDLETDSNTRTDIIIDLFDELNSFSKSEWIELIKEMEDILNFNYNHFNYLAKKENNNFVKQIITIFDK